jgi:large subunit ribosomal protein L20
MVRVRSVLTAHRRKKRVLKKAKGFYAQKSKRYQQAKRALLKARAYAYRDRKVSTREFRSLWIVRINAACKAADITYSRFIKGLSNAKVEVNRKVMADLAVHSPEAFNKLVEISKAALK